MTQTVQNSLTTKPRLGLIGIPLDENSTYMRGSALAPQRIREALYCESTNTWCEAGINIGAGEVFVDAGDVDFTGEADSFEKIESAIDDLLVRGLLPLSLGGDHAITYPIIKAIKKKYPVLHILHFDAHPDLYDELYGNRRSHACPFARIMENEYAQRLVQVGIRTMNGHQRAQAERFGVEVMEMKNWYDDITLKFDAPLYISLDLDVLDPAFAPGISHYEPGGMSTRQVVRILQNVKAPQLVGADIVELNPLRDPTGLTAMVAAKLFKEIAARMITQK